MLRNIVAVDKYFFGFKTVKNTNGAKWYETHMH